MMTAALTALEPVLELRDVTVHFGGRRGLFSPPAPSVKAVEGVDLTVGGRRNGWSRRRIRLRQVDVVQRHRRAVAGDARKHPRVRA